MHERMKENGVTADACSGNCRAWHQALAAVSPVPVEVSVAKALSRGDQVCIIEWSRV
jgi:hypothetical protein